MAQIGRALEGLFVLEDLKISAAILGVIAAVVPAYRATRVDIIEAIATT